MTETSPSTEVDAAETSPRRLAELTASHPDLHARIARHPQAYPDLLLWIAGNGDADARSAAARRIVESPPPPPLPGAPRVADGPVPQPPGDAEPPASPKIPAKAHTKSTKTRTKSRAGAVVGITIGIVAVGVTAALVIPALITPREFTVADLVSKPSIGVWQINGPANAPADSISNVRTDVTVGQDQSLVFWDTTTADGAVSTWSSLIDTAKGTEAWSMTVDPAMTNISPVGDGLGADGVVLRGSAADGTAVTARLDLETGEITTAPGLEALAAPTSLEGDVIVREAAANAIHRWDPVSSEFEWTVPIDGAESTLIAGSTLLLGTRAIALEDGSDRGWMPDPAMAYSDAGGRLFAVWPNGETTVLGAVSESDGTFGWQIEAPADTRVIPLAETGFVAASSATTGTYQVIDLEEGSAFSFDSVIAEDLRGLFASGSGSIAAVPIGDGTTATVLDLDAKSATFAVPLAPDGVPQSILAASSQSLYLAGGAAGALQAVDRATGETRWTLENPAPPSFGFAEWGGNLVMVRAPGGDPSIAVVQGVR